MGMSELECCLYNQYTGTCLLAIQKSHCAISFACYHSHSDMQAQGNAGSQKLMSMENWGADPPGDGKTVVA